MARKSAKQIYFLADLKFRHSQSRAFKALEADPDFYMPLALSAAEDLEMYKTVSRMLFRLVKRRPDLATSLFILTPASLPRLAIRFGRIAVEGKNPTTFGDQLIRARLWNDLSERYLLADEPDAGVKCAQEAVRRHTSLARQRRDARLDLINSLEVLAKQLTALGRHKEAIVTSSSAVRRAFRLATDIQGTRVYSRSRLTLAFCLLEAGDPRRALKSAAIAHVVLHKLSDRGAPFLEDIGWAALAVASSLIALQKFEEAHPFAVHAFEYFQRLSAYDHSRFLRPYLSATDILATTNYMLGIQDASRAVPGDALEAIADLVRKDSRSFLEEYLNSLLRYTATLERPEDLNRVIQLTALTVRRTKALANGYRGQEIAARATANLALFLYECGKVAASRRAASKALRLFRGLPSNYPVPKKWMESMKQVLTCQRAVKTNR